jgi:hypothetical protein
MLKLELDEREAKDLKMALSVRIMGMREELNHTDHRDYREGLKALIGRLEAVLDRLDKAIAAMPAAA